MRIDAHQHFWRYDPAAFDWIDEPMAALRRDFLPRHLAPEMAAAGVDACVAVQATHTLDETRWLLGLCDAYPFVAGVVGWADLQAADVEAQLAGLAHPRLVGIRHIAQSEPDDRFLLRPSFCRGIRALGERGLAYDILIYPRQLPAAIELAGRFPTQRFVLDHLAKPPIRTGAIDEWSRLLWELAAAPHVCCKLSGLVTEADWRRWQPEDIHPYLDVAFECFGADRLMAGSDWPVCTVAADYSRTMAVVSDYLDHRAPAERDAVLGGTARRFWDLRVQAIPDSREQTT